MVSALKEPDGALEKKDSTLLWEVAKTEEWSGSQRKTMKEETSCHTQKSELNPVGDRKSLRDLSCILYITWRCKGRKERHKARSQLGGYNSNPAKR